MTYRPFPTSASPHPRRHRDVDAFGHLTDADVEAPYDRRIRSIIQYWVDPHPRCYMCCWTEYVPPPPPKVLYMADMVIEALGASTDANGQKVVLKDLQLHCVH